MELAMIQNQIIELSKLDSVYLDRGIFFGDGVYEVVRTYDGKIFALEEHLARFNRSLQAIEIKDVDINDIRDRILTAYKKSNIADCAIYFHITRGSAPRNHEWSKDIKSNFFMTLTEIKDYQRLKKTGVKLCTDRDLRWQRCDIKSLNLLPNVLARHRAVGKGCFEALLLDSRGDITECAGSAFAAIYGNKIITRPLSPKILPSITRSYLSKIAVMTGMELIEKTLNIYDLANADEMFIAVTTKDILGVIELDGKAVSNNAVGEKTKQLQAAFRVMVQELTTSTE